MNKRKAHWEQVYADKSPLEVSWYQQVPALSLGLILKSGISHDAPIIDVGGGASTLVDHLCEAGYSRISVLDISAAALACARERLAQKAEQIEWYATDVTAFRAKHPYLLWHDRAVFHFLTDKADRRKYVDALEDALPVGGHLIIAAFAIDGPTQCSGLDIVQYDAEKLCSELGEKFALVESVSENHTTPANKVQRFNYFRFVRQK